ncbi:DUF1854 domain-containing protein [Cohnella fermenti]|uniref:DUF1854 domain-containing protein n=1 Tax=Cohnella fermenti TaxID=2565925 RepID=A0A4S4BLK8_9BACL|nr:DUF1854 domain-containing protein [Cohnella fermenti]THF74711.1 DUF1854 domain-containing protein [Cohnella fermenti]
MSSTTSLPERSWISPDSIRFRKEEGGGLRAEWRSLCGGVTVRRLFPLSHPNSAIWVGDRSGNEWGVLRSLDDMEPVSLAALIDELRLSPFLPRITKLISLRRRLGSFNWAVETDAGGIRFTTGPLYETVAELPGGDRLVVDRDEQMYVLASDRMVDRKTRRKLAKWL